MSGITDVTRLQVDIDEFAFHTHVRDEAGDSEKRVPAWITRHREGARPRGIIQENFDASVPQEIIPSRNFAALGNDTFMVPVSDEIFFRKINICHREEKKNKVLLNITKKV